MYQKPLRHAGLSAVAEESGWQTVIRTAVQLPSALHEDERVLVRFLSASEGAEYGFRWRDVPFVAGPLGLGAGRAAAAASSEGGHNWHPVRVVIVTTAPSRPVLAPCAPAQIQLRVGR